MERRLLRDGSLEVVKVGDKLLASNAEEYEVVAFEPPRRPESTGRVYVKRGEWPSQSYYPSVFRCHYERPSNIARQTLMELPAMLPGGVFEELNGFPVVTYIGTKRAMNVIAAKLALFETIQFDYEELETAGPSGFESIALQRWRVQVYAREVI